MRKLYVSFRLSFLTIIIIIIIYLGYLFIKAIYLALLIK